MMCYGQFKLKQPCPRFTAGSSSTVSVIQSRGGGGARNAAHFAVFSADSNEV